MALASDLMGLGLPPIHALKIADGGGSIAGSLALTATGNSFATGATIKVDRLLVTVSNGNNTLAVSLPGVSGNVCLADQYKVVNTGTDTVVVWGSTGVTISARGTNTSFSLLAPGSTLVVFPITVTASTATWAGWSA